MAADERLVFVDASAWVAITNRKDRNHRLAVLSFRRLLGSSTRLVATNWTIYEALTIVKSRLGITPAEWLWDRLSARSVVDVIRIDEPIERAGLELFWKYRDKAWGVVDCSSLVVMDALGCRHGFAYDKHFVEAGRQFGFTLVQ
jgi:predicted nucleic acid-binding protein